MIQYDVSLLFPKGRFELHDELKMKFFLPNDETPFDWNHEILAYSDTFKFVFPSVLQVIPTDEFLEWIEHHKISYHLNTRNMICTYVLTHYGKALPKSASVVSVHYWFENQADMILYKLRWQR